MGKPTDTKKGPKIIKLQIPAGKANPAPPVGSALGQHGVDIQAREIGEKKMKDLSANDVEAATKIIAGTCRSMGIEIKD